MSNEQTDVSLQDLDAAPEALPVKEGINPDLAPRLNADFTRVTEENSRLKDECQELRQKLRSKETLDSLITPMANHSFKFMCYYSACVGLLLTFHGFGFRVKLFSGEGSEAFKLPESVLNFLVGSTAVTVIGLVGMVLTGVFVGARK